MSGQAVLRQPARDAPRRRGHARHALPGARLARRLLAKRFWRPPAGGQPWRVRTLDAERRRRRRRRRLGQRQAAQLVPQRADGELAARRANNPGGLRRGMCQT
jgi:hypothetical protein